MTTQEEWWLINNIDKIDSPALNNFNKQVKKNILMLINMI
jgi:hypothetical protein